MFDKSIGMNAYRLDEASYDQLLIEFVEQMAEKQALMSVAISCPDVDWDLIAALTHSVKGVSGSLRITAVHELAILLEKEVAGKNIDSVKKQINEMSQLFDDVNHSIRYRENPPIQ